MDIVKIIDTLCEKYNLTRIGSDYILLDDIGRTIIKTAKLAHFRSNTKTKVKIDGKLCISYHDMITLISRSRKPIAKDIAKNIIRNPDFFENSNDTEENDYYFKFGDHNLIFVEYNSKIWIKAKDVCDILGYVNSNKAISDHIDDDEKIKVSDLITDRVCKNLPLMEYQENPIRNTKKLGPMGYLQNMQKSTIFISESGLYTLIILSKMKKAKEFRKWVTNEVLPSIRKTGTYTVSNSKSIPSLLPDFGEKGETCIYLLDLYDNGMFYKYGISENIPRRMAAHRNKFPKLRLLNIFKCENRTLGTRVEQLFKKYCQSIKINKKHKSMIEIFQCDENAPFDMVIEKLKSFVDTYGFSERRKYVDKKITEAIDTRLADTSAETAMKVVSLEKELKQLKDYMNEAQANPSNMIFSKQSKCPECDNLIFNPLGKCDFCVERQVLINKINARTIPHYAKLKKLLQKSSPKKIALRFDMTVPEIKELQISLQLKNLKEYEPPQLEETNNRREYVGKCTDCDVSITRNSSRCKACLDKHKFLESVKNTNRPKYSLLKNKIENTGYATVGREYKVSPPTLKKWLAKYEKYNMLD